MDTQDSGTSTEELQLDDPSTEQSEETTQSDTSTDGAPEDAATLKKQLSDKDRYIKQLEAERKQKKAVKVEDDPDDMIMWTTLHADDLKMVGKEYQEELSFYKTHGIKVNQEIRERALRDAKAKRGIQTVSRQPTSSETGGEMRKTESKEIPESVKEVAPKITQEQFLRYKAEFDAEKKR